MWGGAAVEKVFEDFEKVTCYWQIAKRGKVGNKLVETRGDREDQLVERRVSYNKTLSKSGKGISK